MVLTTDLSNIMFSSTPKIYTVEIRVDGKALACRRFIQEGQFTYKRRKLVLRCISHLINIYGIVLVND